MKSEQAPVSTSHVVSTPIVTVDFPPMPKPEDFQIRWNSSDLREQREAYYHALETWKEAVKIMTDGINLNHSGQTRSQASSSSSPSPARPVAETIPEKQTLAIKVVNPPRDQDPVTGLFLVTVATTVNGKAADLPFIAVSDISIVFKQRIEGTLIPVTNFSSNSPGNYMLYVDFPGLMTKIVFQLEDGGTAEVRLRK
ncbi:MAG: hypothetical protein WDN47_04100 [Candidatus Doudnabacteria bacterium]